VIKNKNIDTAFEIYLALYQCLVYYEDDILDAYRQFSPDFFDLIASDSPSRLRLPTICILIGNPVCVCPTGITTTGCPVKANGNV